MFRFLMAIALLRLLGQSTGIDLLVQSCETPCEEALGGDCSPGCEDCLCCSHPRTAMLQTELAKPVPAPSRSEIAEPIAPTERSGANEIVHIPKRALSA